jgi:type I restriction enzyme S subunit
MSELKKYKLGDLGFFFGGVTTIGKEDYGHGTPFLPYKNVYKNSKVNVNELELMNIRPQDIERRSAIYGDIFFTASSETPDEVAMSSVLLDDVANLTYNGFCKRYRLNDFNTLLPEYARYLFRDINFRREVYQVATGDIRFNISQESLAKIEIEIPDVATQAQLAEILMKLDDKIELNLQMNQTLEAMAQALFKEWCWVEEGIVPKGWSWKKLLEIADVSSSKRIFRDEYILKGVPFYRGKEVTQLSNGEAISTELFISEERYSEIKEKFGVPQIGDILITSVGTIGSVWLVDNDAPFYFKDGNVTWIKDYKTAISGEFVYQWLQTKEAKEQIKSVTIGSTQQALTISALRGLNILIPDTETVSNVCIQLEKINAKRINNLNQIQSLTQTRDTLLPKLMSGKLELV